MTDVTRFDPATQTVALGIDRSAALLPARPDPMVPVEGFTFGVATMSENPPHGGEMHPDGDEVVYLISGRVIVELETEPAQRVELTPGQGLLVPRGVWHRVDIQEPCQLIYVTAGPGGEWRPPEA